MLPRLQTPTLPRDRPSPSAMIAVGVLHAGLLWLLSQSLPVQRAVRYVVVHYVQPVSSSSSSAKFGVCSLSRSRLCSPPRSSSCTGAARN